MICRLAACMLPSLLPTPATSAFQTTPGPLVRPTTAGLGAPLAAANLGLHCEVLEHDPAEPAAAALLAVKESMQGFTDLNGDGDTFDTVLHVLPAGSNTPVNLGLALPTTGVEFQAAHVAGTHALVLVQESEQGVDLNGDGDASDMVLHLYDVASGVTTNLELACSTDVRLSRDSALVWVFESKQGGADLNGDGDALDRVAHHVRPSTGVVRNLGLAHGLVPVESGDARLWGFGVDELAQGADLDGDGLLDSVVPHLFEPAAGVVTVLASPTLRYLGARYGHAAVARDEALQGADLNGDGDLLDKVVEIVDPAGTSFSTGHAVADVNGILLLGTLRLREAYGTMQVYESQQSADLNGDGDLSDLVTVVIDLATGTVTSSGKTGDPYLAGHRLLQGEWEFDQGAQDLNGDGDVVDNVVSVLDLETWTSTNLGLAGSPLAPGLNLVALPVPEVDQGQQDLNGDGDVQDWIWHVHELATGTTHNLGLAATGNDNKLTGRDFAVFRVFEAYCGGIDLNGDGDAGDPGILVFDGPSGSVTNLGLAASTVGVLLGRRVVFRVSEKSTGSINGGTDLNGDGDDFDHVLFVVDLP